MIENNDLLLIDRKVTDVDFKKQVYKGVIIRYAINGEIGVFNTGHIDFLSGAVFKYTYNNLFMGQITIRKVDYGEPLYDFYVLYQYDSKFNDFASEDYTHFKINKNLLENIRNDFDNYCKEKNLEFNYENFKKWFIVDLDLDYSGEIPIILDNNTVIKLQSQGQANIYQTGIVSKKAFEAYEQEKQREKEKQEEELRLYHEQQKKRQEAEESDTVDLVIKNGHFWANINTNLIGLNAYIKNDISCKEVDIECIAKTKYQYKAVEHFANQPPIIKANIGASITLKKNQFFWKEGEVYAYGKRHNITNKEEFFTLLNEHKLYAELSVSDGLSLGILIEDKELKQKRKAEKTKKHVIITSVIVAIIAVIGIIVF